VNGGTAPNFSSGQAIAAMEEVARNTLPNGYGFEWTEFAFQEKAAANTALLIFPLCVLFVWLTHSAEYESFLLSTAIILIFDRLDPAVLLGQRRDRIVQEQLSFAAAALEGNEIEAELRIMEGRVAQIDFVRIVESPVAFPPPLYREELVIELAHPSTLLLIVVATVARFRHLPASDRVNRG
jgi:hypothetical protein